MIGEHSVLLYSDRTGGAWTQVLPNPYFTADRSGWIDGDWGTHWTWVGDGTVTTGGAVIDFYAGLATMPLTVRPPGADTYEVRIKCRTSAPSTRMNVFVGFAPNADRTGWVSHYISYADWGPGEHTLIAPFTYTAGAGDAYVGTDLHFAINPGPDGIPANVPLPHTVVVDQIELRLRDTTPAVDLTCLVDEVAIRHGRSDTTEQPSAASATIDLSTDPAHPLPVAVDVGALVVVSTMLDDGMTVTRFAGLITDVSSTWDDSGRATPDLPTTQIVAVSQLADLGRRVIGDVPWPAELDGARVARILSLAGSPVSPGWSDPGTVQILARDVDAQPALELAHEAADSAGGIVWHTRAGEVLYADADHRRGAGVALTLDACDVLVAPLWQRNLDGLVNDVSIRYGVAPDGGEQPEYRASNATSIAQRGRYAASITTELATLADATAFGQLLLVRNSSPVWVMSALPVAVKDLDDARTHTLLNLEVGSLIQVTGLPAVGAAPTSVAMWVEGWGETLAHGSHEISLVVSGYCRTVPPPRWNDLDPAWTWDTITPQSLTWDATTCLGPTTDLGRWDDVPASLRWDAITPASTTWDQWTKTPGG